MVSEYGSSRCGQLAKMANNRKSFPHLSVANRGGRAHHHSPGWRITLTPTCNFLYYIYSNYKKVTTKKLLNYMLSKQPKKLAGLLRRPLCCHSFSLFNVFVLWYHLLLYLLVDKWCGLAFEISQATKPCCLATQLTVILRYSLVLFSLYLNLNFISRLINYFI